VHPGQLGDATPCTEWNVRMLINHVVSGNLFFVHLAIGSTPPVLPLSDLDQRCSSKVTTWVSAS
jgi:hypothetical protein